MNITQSLVNKISYNDFQLLIEQYGLSRDDCQFGNDRYYVADVADDCLEITEDVIDCLRFGICCEYDMGRFLALAVRDKIIEPGTYVMYVSW